MNRTAERLTPTIEADTAPVVYEQPLGERMRTFLRLEYLYQQLLFNIERESPCDTRAAMASLLDIISILTRGDLRGDILKALERQLHIFDSYQNTPSVDEGRLAQVMRNLHVLRAELKDIGPKYLAGARESEFLNSVKHRSSIPGGTCEFDLPDYSFWLRKPYPERFADMRTWTRNIRPLCDAVGQLMWLLRASGQTIGQVAAGGVFQYTLGRNVSAGLLRVSLDPELTVYPEISGSQHRFTVRFMEWASAEERATQTTTDIPFSLTIC